jgi:hypothetical protein
MGGNTVARILLAFVLLSAIALVTVEAHGRSLQAQQALQLPKGFKIPNIFNTCECQFLPFHQQLPTLHAALEQS